MNSISELLPSFFIAIVKTACMQDYSHTPKNDSVQPVQMMQNEGATPSFDNQRPEAGVQRRQQLSANGSDQVSQLKSLQAAANAGIQRKVGGDAPIQAMFSAAGRIGARTLGKTIGGAILAEGVNEGVRRGVDHMGQGHDATSDASLQDTSLGNAAARVGARHTPYKAPDSDTGHSMVGSSIEAIDRHRSANPLAEGAMEGPYGRSEFGRKVFTAPWSIPAAMKRGGEAVQNGYDFATADPTTQVVDVAGAGMDSIAEMDPIKGMGTAMRTGADLASSEQRERFKESATSAVNDSGQRMAAQVGTGVLLSGAMRTVPVIGPAASAVNLGLTIGSAMSSAGKAADESGSMVHHIEQRTAARRNALDQPK